MSSKQAELIASEEAQALEGEELDSEEVGDLAESEEKAGKLWTEVYSSATELRWIEGDSFRVQKEAAAGTFLMVTTAAGTCLYCVMAGKLLEIHRDSAVHEGSSLAVQVVEAQRDIWPNRSEYLQKALAAQKGKVKREGKVPQKLNLNDLIVPSPAE